LIVIKASLSGLYRLRGTSSLTNLTICSRRHVLLLI